MFEFLFDWTKKEWHVKDEDLLLYADGELSPRKVARLRAHLEHCWQCRVKAEKNEQIISQLVDYLNCGFPPCLPVPPNLWRGFDAKLQRAVAEPDKVKLTSRLFSVLNAIFPRRSISLRLAGSCAALALVLFLITRIHLVPTVSASDLLHQAIESDRQELRRVSKPVLYQRLKIRAVRHSVTRTIYRDLLTNQVVYSHSGVDAFSGATLPPTQVHDFEIELQRIFRAADLDWNDPLSAKAFSDWRDSLAERQDHVEKYNGQLILTTTTSHGPISEASLTVRTTDFHPLAERLVLQDERTIEISELAGEVLSSDDLDRIIFKPEPRLPTPPLSAQAAREPQLPTDAQLLAAELQARIALHAARADLGEEVEVLPRSGVSVLVSGVVQSRERKRDLIGALANIPYIDIRLNIIEETRTDQGGQPRAPTQAVIVSGRPLLQDRLIEHFPDVRERAAFVNNVLSLVDTAMAHAWAVRRLESRYTARQVTHLNPAGRQTLELLVRDHVMAIRECLSTDEGLIGSFIPAAIATASDQHNNSGAVVGWRGSATDIFSSVQNVQRDLEKLLSGSNQSGANPEIVIGALQTDLGQAQAQLSALTRSVEGPFIANEVLVGAVSLE